MLQWFVEILQWFVGTSLAVFLMKTHLASYLSKKGENLATKEDIGKITEEIERVRNQYEQRTEQLKFQLGVLAHTKNVLYERRFIALEGIWRSLVSLKTAVGRVNNAKHSNSIKKDEYTALAEQFIVAMEAAHDAIENNKFLCSTEIAVACENFLQSCLNQALSEAKRQSQKTYLSDSEEILNEIKHVQELIGQSIDAEYRALTNERKDAP